MAIQRFQIPYSESAVQALRDRLARTRWPDTIPGSRWEHGFDLEYLQSICGYWRESFDWEAETERIGRLHHLQYTTGGQSIHFVHERGKGAAPIPILLLHGWPSSFLEMQRLLPRLIEPAACGGDARDSFDVVIPSLPGFGFSSRPRERGMNTARMSDLFVGLMRALGYERFACHAGDFGGAIASSLGRRHSARIIGLHFAYSFHDYRPVLRAGTTMSEVEREFLREADRWEQELGAYAHLQSRAPLTAAYGLTDSPAALAAWILEKFRDWSDCDGDLETRFTKDELLANVTLYWMTETIHSSCRLYFEERQAPLNLLAGERIEVPCAVAHFPKEEPFPPRTLIERGYNVQQWADMASGGHFPALEEPAALTASIRTFFRRWR